MIFHERQCVVNLAIINGIHLSHIQDLATCVYTLFYQALFSCPPRWTKLFEKLITPNVASSIFQINIGRILRRPSFFT